MRLRRHVRLDEFAYYSKRTRARECLCRCDAAASHSLALTEKQLLREDLEIIRPINGAILLVELATEVCQHLLLSLFHNLQNEWLSILRAAGAHAEVYLLR